jgi:hypothetical protein
MHPYFFGLVFVFFFTGTVTRFAFFFCVTPAITTLTFDESSTTAFGTLNIIMVVSFAVTRRTLYVAAAARTISFYISHTSAVGAISHKNTSLQYVNV